MTVGPAKRPAGQLPRPVVVGLSTITFLVSGTLFLLFTALRPTLTADQLTNLAALSNQRWLIAHLCVIFAFITLTLALSSFRMLNDLANEQTMWLTSFLTWLALSLVLPYLGALAYGGRAIGDYGTDLQQSGAFTIYRTMSFSMTPVLIFGLGVIVLAIAGLSLTVATWDSPRDVRVGATLLGICMGTFGTQYFLPYAAQVIHGTLGLIACLILSRACWHYRLPHAREARTSTPL